MDWYSPFPLSFWASPTLYCLMGLHNIAWKLSFQLTNWTPTNLQLSSYILEIVSIPSNSKLLFKLTQKLTKLTDIYMQLLPNISLSHLTDLWLPPRSFDPSLNTSTNYGFSYMTQPYLTSTPMIHHLIETHANLETSNTDPHNYENLQDHTIFL